MQSRSISPKRRPPSRARPSTGCRVRICTGPRPLQPQAASKQAGRALWSRRCAACGNAAVPSSWCLSAPRVYLVVHHVLETLIIGGVEKDLRLQLPPSVSIVHHLPATALVPAPAAQAHKREGGTGGRHSIKMRCAKQPSVGIAVLKWQNAASRVRPHLCRAAEMLSTVTDVKGVASPSLPMHAATCIKPHL